MHISPRFTAFHLKLTRRSNKWGKIEPLRLQKNQQNLERRGDKPVKRQDA